MEQEIKENKNVNEVLHSIQVKDGDGMELKDFKQQICDEIKENKNLNKILYIIQAIDCDIDGMKYLKQQIYDEISKMNVIKPHIIMVNKEVHITTLKIGE